MGDGQTGSRDRQTPHVRSCSLRWLPLRTARTPGLTREVFHLPASCTANTLQGELVLRRHRWEFSEMQYWLRVERRLQREGLADGRSKRTASVMFAGLGCFEVRPSRLMSTPARAEVYIRLPLHTQQLTANCPQTSLRPVSATESTATRLRTCALQHLASAIELFQARATQCGEVDFACRRGYSLAQRTVNQAGRWNKYNKAQDLPSSLLSPSSYQLRKDRSTIHWLATTIHFT